MRTLVVGLALALGAAAPFAGNAHANDLYAFLSLDKSVVKWGAPETGTGARVSYAFVTNTIRLAGVQNCQEMQSPWPLTESSGVAASDFVSEVEAAFAMWSDAADISFYRIDDPNREIGRAHV